MGINKVIKHDLNNQASLLAELALKHKAENVLIYDVGSYCDYADSLIVLTASSSRHAQALCEYMVDFAQVSSSRVEGRSAGTWILLDLGDVVVHIFTSDTRDHYHFDKLWAHCPHYQVKDNSPQSSSHTFAAQPSPA